MTTTKPTPEKRKAPKRLTPAQKAEAIALWKAGSTTLDDLAKKFKKDRSTFVRLFKDTGTEKGATRAEAERKITEAVEASVVDDAILRANRTRETKEEHYKYARIVSTLTYSLIARAKQENRPYGSLLGDLKAIEVAARVFKITREEKYIALNIREDEEDDEKELPILSVQELTAQDIKRLHEQSLMADDELGLNEELGDEELIVPGDNDFGDEDTNERIEVDD